MDPARRHRSRSRQPRNPSRSRTLPTIPRPWDEEPAPAYTAPSGNRSPDPQYSGSPMRHQQPLPSSFPPNTTQPWEPASRLTTPPTAPMAGTTDPSSGNITKNNNNGGGGRQPAPSASPAVTGKSKRVRTGCLTCRERHLKCDEGLPECNNCRKSSRECRRGIRLNFIDVQVKDPPCLPPTADWSCLLPFCPSLTP